MTGQESPKRALRVAADAIIDPLRDRRDQLVETLAYALYEQYRFARWNPATKSARPDVRYIAGSSAKIDIANVPFSELTKQFAEAFHSEASDLLDVLERTNLYFSQREVLQTVMAAQRRGDKTGIRQSIFDADPLEVAAVCRLVSTAFDRLFALAERDFMTNRVSPKGTISSNTTTHGVMFDAAKHLYQKWQSRLPQHHGFRVEMFVPASEPNTHWIKETAPRLLSAEKPHLRIDSDNRWQVDVAALEFEDLPPSVALPFLRFLAGVIEDFAGSRAVEDRSRDRAFVMDQMFKKPTNLARRGEEGELMFHMFGVGITQLPHVNLFFAAISSWHELHELGQQSPGIAAGRLPDQATPQFHASPPVQDFLQ